MATQDTTGQAPAGTTLTRAQLNQKVRVDKYNELKESQIDAGTGSRLADRRDRELGSLARGLNKQKDDFLDLKNKVETAGSNASLDTSSVDVRPDILDEVTVNSQNERIPSTEEPRPIVPRRQEQPRIAPPAEETPSVPPGEEQRNVSRIPWSQVNAFNRMDDDTARRFGGALGKVAYEAARATGARNVSAEAAKIRRSLELAASGAYYDGHQDYAVHNFGSRLVSDISSLVQEVQSGKSLEEVVDYLNENYHGIRNSAARNTFNYLLARETSSDQQLDGVGSAQQALDLLKDRGLIVAGNRPGTSKFVQVDTNTLGDRERYLLERLLGVESSRQRYGVTIGSSMGL